jgi:hypothetical protein
MSDETLKNAAARNQPEIILSGVQSPVFNDVMAENQLLKNQVKELQTVIVNMCVMQQRSQSVDQKAPKKVRLKSATETRKPILKSPSVKSPEKALDLTSQVTPLPEDLNEKPKSSEKVMQALQKEWHAVISRNLFDVPITESSNNETTQENSSEIKRRVQPRSRTTTNTYSKTASVKSLGRRSSAQERMAFLLCSCKSKGSI